MKITNNKIMLNFKKTKNWFFQKIILFLRHNSLQIKPNFNMRMLAFDPFWNHRILLSENRDVRRLFENVLSSDTIALDISEIWSLYRTVNNLTNIKGDLAELGVFRGGSARVILEADKKKILHLFDTFEGIPEVTQEVDTLNIGSIRGSTLGTVKSYLESYSERIVYHQGIFPKSAQNLPTDRVHSFVHMDLDVYQSTKAGLNYFGPKMSKGGVIMIHDYNSISCPGVKKAVDEYLVFNNKTKLELWHTQIALIF